MCVSAHMDRSPCENFVQRAAARGVQASGKRPLMNRTGHSAPIRIASRAERYRKRFSRRESALDCCSSSGESLPDNAVFTNNQYFVLLSAFRGLHISDVKNADQRRNLRPFTAAIPEGPHAHPPLS